MKSKALLGLILILGFFLRVYKIDIALADHHSWRQADTAAVARNFLKEGWSFFRPKIDNLVPLHPGVPNRDRLFLVEPPIYNSLVAGVYQLVGVDIRWARLVSILFYLGSTILLYLLVKEWLNQRTAWLAAFFFTVLPFNVFYSRVVLPEPMIIFFCLGLLFFASRWVKTATACHYWLFGLFGLLAFSQKAFPLFLLLPIGYLLLRKHQASVLINKKVFLWLALALAPMLAWRWWVAQTPAGVPAYDWLFNQGDIRFKGAFFYWIFAKRIGELILGWWGLPLLVLGLVLRPRKEGYFFHLWLLAVFLFVVIFAAGNVTHDYYQIPFVPIICVFLAKGADFLLFKTSALFSKRLCFLLFAFCFLLMLAFSWYQVRDFYNLQGGVDLAGQAVDELTPPDALVITGDSNDATLLYNTNRWGWSAGYASAYPNSRETILQLRGEGATYYVTTRFDRNSDFGQYLLNNFSVVKQTDQYVIFKL